MTEENEEQGIGKYRAARVGSLGRGQEVAYGDEENGNRIRSPLRV